MVKKGVELAYKMTPDIIVSDIMMPIMDGIELCKLLKNNIKNKPYTDNLIDS